MKNGSGSLFEDSVCVPSSPVQVVGSVPCDDGYRDAEDVAVGQLEEEEDKR